MKAITFLGTTDYKTTIYAFGDHTFETRFFAEALPSFFPDLNRIFVFVTPTVQQHDNLTQLKRCLGPLLQPVPIPEGHSEAELWQIFDALTATVAEHDEVLFDITHSFRSIPLLVFLAAAYMRAVRGVDVKGVIYGAWEARDQETNVSPVFDLTPFVTLLDWLTAAERFTQTGDGCSLATLLRERVPPGLTMGEDLQARNLGNGLKQAATAIEAISLALRVTRPIETMEATAHLDVALQRAQPAIAAHVRPFALLTDQVRSAYTPFALSNPLDRAKWPDNLRIQLALVHWYLEKGQIVQAATLAREWVVSFAALRLGADSLVNLEGVRFPIEGALNNACRRRAGKSIDRPSHYDDPLAALPEINTLVAAWNRLGDLRNDIAHVGMNENPKKVARLCQDMTRIYPLLETLGKAIL